MRANERDWASAVFDGRDWLGQLRSAKGRWTAGGFAAAIVLLGCMAGCGKAKPGALVSGTLTVNNRPLPQCLVRFFPEAGRSGAEECCCGATDAEGRYELRFTDQRVGAAPGRYRIILDDLEILQPIDRGNGDAEPQPCVKRTSGPALRFDPVYQSSKETPLHCEVKKGKQKIDIELPKTVVWQEGS